MPRAVQLTAYGGIEQLRIVEVAKPEPAEGEIVVRVVAAGANPGEISIREGLLKDVFPMEFPFGQGTDFAGRVDSVGAGVTGFAPGGSLFVVATTAVAAVRAVSLKPGEVVAVSGAAGGVGSLAVQLARRTGARVIGIASGENASFLRSVGVEPVAYGDSLAQRLQALAPKGLDAFIDLFGGGYVELAAKLGVSRINTVIDFAAAEKYGTKTDGSSAAASRETIALVADLIAWGEIVMPLTAIYPFALVRDAYIQLARRKARGKIVLAFDATISEPIRPPKPTAQGSL
jgi:NADPH:quinone reductase-like Zn-dependent oxidoreductase